MPSQSRDPSNIQLCPFAQPPKTGEYSKRTIAERGRFGTLPCQSMHLLKKPMVPLADSEPKPQICILSASQFETADLNLLGGWP